MSKGINLLPVETKNTVAIVTKLLVVRTIAVIVLFAVSFLSLGLSIFIAFSPLPKLKKQETELLGYMTALHPKAAKQLVIIDRMTQISTIVSHRTNFDTMISLLQETFPQAVSIDELSVEGKEMTIRISNNSLALIDTSITNLQQVNEKQKIFSRIVMSEITYNYGRGAYTAQIDLITK